WSKGPLLVRDDNGQLLRESDLHRGGQPSILLALDQQSGALLRYDSQAGNWLDNPAHAGLRALTRVNAIAAELSCRTAFEHYAQAAAQYPPDRVAKLTGISAASLHEAAEIIGTAKSLAYYAWNGVGQSNTATQTDRAISLLYTLTGHYGAPGGNVPGGAASFNDISGLDLLPQAQRDKALGLAERPLGPGLNGWVTARDVYKAVLEHQPYPVRMLMSFGTNLLYSQPDPASARAALQALEFHVHADFFLNPSAQFADIVLPVSTSWEREGLRTGFDASVEGLRRVQLRPAVVTPVGQARSDIDIVLGLAEHLGLSEQFFSGDVNAGYEQILTGSGVGLAALRAQPEGVDVAGSANYRPYAQVGTDDMSVGFPTPSKRIEIYSELLHRHGQPAVPTLVETELPQQQANYPLRLSCAKTMTYCHSQHRNIESLRRLLPEPILEMSQPAAAERGIINKDWVDIKTRSGAFIARARLVPDTEPGSVFAQHGWWALGTPSNMNSVIDTSDCDPISGSIALRCSWCEVRKLTIDELFAYKLE
ncbi:MAG: molybdopterin dinucleotide binding domain-containing protein, partial [Burkholderiaceae bacterium]